MIKNRRDIWSDGTYTVAYGNGAFDEWCMYVIRKDGSYFPPRDEWYFGLMANWSDPAGMYKEFVDIYSQTTGEVEQELLDKISGLTHLTDQHRLILILLYLGMVAEEKKANAVLKKRIKRLGVHQVLVEGMRPSVAANFSRGKTVAQIEPECASRGF